MIYSQEPNFCQHILKKHIYLWSCPAQEMFQDQIWDQTDSHLNRLWNKKQFNQTDSHMNNLSKAMEVE